jgi:hypothetical protein
MCDCGKTKQVAAANLLHGRSLSCGCIRGEQLGRRNTERLRTHGASGTREHRIWSGMINRCTNPRSKDFKNYGARGIAVCERWLSFENFIEDMGQRPSARHSIERVDNDGPYSPDNCIWGVPKDQCTNRRGNLHHEHNGRTMTLAEWADEMGVPRPTVYWRYRKGIRGDDLFHQAMGPRTS